MLLEAHAAEDVNVEPARKQIVIARDRFTAVIEAVERSLPLSNDTLDVIRAIDWESVTERGIRDGFLTERDSVWDAIVSGVQRGDPLVAPRAAVAKLSQILHFLEEDRTASTTQVFRLVRLYNEILRVGLKSSYANMVVGERQGADTVPGEGW